MMKLNKQTIFLSLFISAELSFAQTKQCQILFKRPLVQVAEHLVFINEAKEALGHLDIYLNSAYHYLQTSKSNLQRNSVIHTIVNLNNQVLDLLESVTQAKDIFNSGAKRILQKELKADIEKLLIDQGFSQDDINAFLQARINFNKNQELLTRTQNPMGFHWNNAEENSSATAKKTFGFTQIELNENPYGRESSDKRKTEPSQNKPMGFVSTDSEATQIQPLHTIGFVQASERNEVSFQLRVEFDFTHGVFIAKSNKKPIGFTN